MLFIKVNLVFVVDLLGASIDFMPKRILLHKTPFDTVYLPNSDNLTRHQVGLAFWCHANFSRQARETNHDNVNAGAQHTNGSKRVFRLFFLYI